MKTKRFALIGTAAVIGLLALTSIGIAFAQTSGGGHGGARGGMMGGDGTTGGHGAMMGQAGGGMMSGGGMMDQMGDHHDEMLQAAAGALGISTDELQAQLDAGKTVPEIATERGVDLAKVREAMQAAHPEGHGQGMMGTGADGDGPGCHGTTNGTTNGTSS